MKIISANYGVILYLRFSGEQHSCKNKLYAVNVIYIKQFIHTTSIPDTSITTVTTTEKNASILHIQSSALRDEPTGYFGKMLQIQKEKREY